MKRLLFLPLIFITSIAYAELPTPLGGTEVGLTLKKALNRTGEWMRFFVAPGSEAQIKNDLGISTFNGGTITTATAINPSLTVTGSSTSSADTAFKVQNSAGSPGLVVLNNGSVCIGTTTPSSIILYVYDTNIDNVPTIFQTMGAGASSNSYRDGFVCSTTGQNGSASVSIWASPTGGHIQASLYAVSYDHPLSLQHLGGKVGIGTTTPSTQLHTTGTLRHSNFGAGAANFDADGMVSSVSDERMKDIVGTFTAGLSELMGINPILHKYNALSGLDTVNTYAGFSAQNVMQFIPEAVGQAPNGYYSLSDRPIIAALVNAVKELQKEIDDLKNKNGVALTKYEIVPIVSTERLVKSKPLPSLIPSPTVITIPTPIILPDETLIVYPLSITTPTP